MVKLYKDFIPEEVPYREQRVVRTLVSMGVNTPDVGRIVTDGKRIGVEFQLISPKKSFARSIAEEPERIEEFAIRFAKAARKLHSTPCDTTVFGNVKDFFNQKITINKYFTDEEKKAMKSRTKELSDEELDQAAGGGADCWDFEGFQG